MFRKQRNLPSKDWEVFSFQLRSKSSITTQQQPQDSRWCNPLATFNLFTLCAAKPRTCPAVDVIDDNTIATRFGELARFEQVRVRFNGIDAPEKKQPFGECAKQAMSDLVYMKDMDLDCRETDRYGRSVCRVHVAPNSAPNGPKTLDAGLALITLGLAWWYRDYACEQTPQERGQYEFAEIEARAKRVGLWLDADAVAPWRMA